MYYFLSAIKYKLEDYMCGIILFAIVIHTAPPLPPPHPTPHPPDLIVQDPQVFPDL